jgi:hypothetical protein
VLLPSPLLAQGLGDTAARERQKREEKKTAAPAKVYTDQDLPAAAAPAGASPVRTGKAVSSRGAPGASETEAKPRDGDLADERGGSAGVADPSSPGPDAAPQGDKAPGPDAASQDDPLEKERQERKLAEAVWRVRFANAREQLAIAETNSWREVVRTEFYQGIPVQMKVKEQIQTDELKQARQALADLTEEFRHTGLPPGWARE